MGARKERKEAVVFIFNDFQELNFLADQHRVVCPQAHWHICSGTLMRPHGASCMGAGRFESWPKTSACRLERVMHCDMRCITLRSESVFETRRRSAVSRKGKRQRGRVWRDSWPSPSVSQSIGVCGLHARSNRIRSASFLFFSMLVCLSA